MPVNVKVSGDPRRPDNVKIYQRPPKDPNGPQGDLMMLAALLLGMLGLVFKYKLAAWGALVCVISSLANVKSAEMDVKQIVSSVCFAVIGILASYLTQPPQRRPPQTAS